MSAHYVFIMKYSEVRDFHEKPFKSPFPSFHVTLGKEENDGFSKGQHSGVLVWDLTFLFCLESLALSQFGKDYILHEVIHLSILCFQPQCYTSIFPFFFSF